MLPKSQPGPARLTGLISALIVAKTRPGRVSVFTAFNRWRHNLFMYCQYCTPFLLHCGLGLGLGLIKNTGIIAKFYTMLYSGGDFFL